MKLTREGEGPDDMWLTRLKLLLQPNRHSAMAFLALGVGVVFVGGGLAVTQQLDNAQRTASVLSTTTTITVAPRSEIGQSQPLPVPNIEGVLPPVQTTVLPITPTERNSSPVPTTAPAGRSNDGAGARPTPTSAPRATATTGAPRPTTPVTVAPAPPTTVIQANGPARPSVRVTPDPARFRPEDPEVAIVARVADEDGYVNRIDIDWNDGSAPTVVEYPLSACSIPSRPASVTQAHTFEAAGTYNVTVTVTSVNCDGSGQQQAIDVMDVTTAGPAVGAPL